LYFILKVRLNSQSSVNKLQAYSVVLAVDVFQLYRMTCGCYGCWMKVK